MQPSATEAMLPATAAVVFLLTTMAVFAARCAVLGRPHTPYVDARHASRLWKWWMEWWIWLWGPVERACIVLGIAPSAITLASTVLSATAAAFLAAGRLSLGGWLYLLAASLDVVDGRVARAQGTSSSSGAFLDSTLDRVSELAVLGGLAVYFRSTQVLYATLAAAGASVLVSYARARGESLGVTSAASVGGMQRAERIVLTGVPCALAPLFDATLGRGSGPLVVGSALVLLALATSVTAVRRSHAIWSALREPELRARGAGNVRWLDAARRRRARLRR